MTSDIDNKRRALYLAALPALEARLTERGVPPLDSRRRVDHVLVDSLTLPVLRRALDDVDGGAGRELRGDPPPFASTESSAALAVNSFAIFAGPSHQDRVLGRRLSDPRFECRFTVKGVKAPVPPTLDVVFSTADEAVLIESKFLEPCRDEITTNISTQYDKPAAAISPGVLATASAVRAGQVTYDMLGAAQMLKHLFGIHSAMATGELPAKSRLVLAYWEPAEAGTHAPLFDQLRAEIEDLAARTADQPVAISGLSYRDLWDGWAQPSAPDWLRAHALQLQRRYGVTLVGS